MNGRRHPNPGAGRGKASGGTSATPAGGLHPWALILLAVVAANCPAVFPGFIFDDHRIIEQNDLVKSLAHVPVIFSRGYWSVGQESVSNLYRPITILSFALNHAIGDLSPFGFRLINLILHALVTCLVYETARRCVGPPVPGAAFDSALVAGLLFAVHPVHTEALGLVVGRAEILAAAGTLGCVLLYLRGLACAADRPGGGLPRAYVGSLACFAAAFLAKENGIVAPVLALLGGLLLYRKLPWTYLGATAVTVAALLGLRVAVLGSLNPPTFVSSLDNPIAHLPFVAGRLTALKGLLRYASLLLFPARLSVDYSYDVIPVARSADLQVVLGAVVLLVWAAGAVFLWRRERTVAFGWIWIGIALAPVANLLVPIGTILAERLLYLPSVGLCLGAAAAADRLERRPAAWGGDPRRRGWARAAFLLLLLVLGVRGLVRYRDWRSDLTVFRAAVATVPRSVRAQYNYGVACEKTGEDEAAIAAYRRALRVDPGFADAHYNLGGVLARRESWDQAVSHLREATRLQPANVQYLVNLAGALNGQGHWEEALEPLRRALEIDPRSDRAYNTLGSARLALGDASGATKAYTEAVRLDPQNADYHRNLALALAQAGDARGAVAAYRRAASLRPEDPNLRVALGGALVQAGETGEGLEILQAMVTRTPDHPVYRYQFALALERAGRSQEAEAQYRESIHLAPAVPMPRRSLGLLLFRIGNREGALDELERAAALDPEGKVMDAEARRTLERLRRPPSADPPPAPQIYDGR